MHNILCSKHVDMLVMVDRYTRATDFEKVIVYTVTE